MAEPLDNPAPAPSRRDWVAVYVVLWFVSFVAFCLLHSAANSLSFDPSRLGASRILLNMAAGFGPWIISFGVGLVFSGVSIFISKPALEHRGAFWKRALAIAWAPALILLYGGWNAGQHKEREDRVLLKRIVEARDRIGKKSSADQQQFIAQVEKLDVPAMLSAEFLVSPVGIARNKAKLEKLVSLVDRQATLSETNALNLKREIAEIVANHPEGSDLRNTIDSAWKERTDLELKIVETQRQFIGVVSNLTEFMSTRTGRVANQDGLIRFETEGEAQRYNAYVQEATKLAQREASLLVQLQRMIEDGTKSLDAPRR